MSEQEPTPRLFGTDAATQAQAGVVGGQPTGPRNVIGAPEEFVQRWQSGQARPTTLATTTGQNLAGARNAFDQDFWIAARRQDEEQTTLRGRWSRPDATGIVTYDYDGDDGEEKVTFGDVFVNGTKVGNMYQGYAGLETQDADEIMARLVLPREVWAAAYETEAGKPLTFTGNLRDEIELARANQSEIFAKGLSAEAFEKGVAERAGEMETSGAWQTGNVAAGVAGGAATAAGIAGVATAVTGGAAAPFAPLIIGVGAALGGFGAWLNRDEQFRQYATALEQWEQATSDGHTAVGYADAAAGFAGAALSSMSVTRNVLHGGYDQLVGEIGDQSSAYQDTETPLWMQGLDMAALLVDGIGSFGSTAARKTFTSLMGIATGAEAVAVGASWADGGYSFDPYSGTYVNLGAAGMAQRSASVGIDAAQTAAAGLLGRVISRATGRVQPGVQTGGHVVTTVNGVQSARLGFSALIPSEASTAVTARMMARRALNKAGREHTRENIRIETARQLERLTTGRKTIALAAVNGFGEGAEEFVQAVLDATAYGVAPTFQELVEAAKSGFGMGFGMGTAMGVYGRSRSQVYLQRANMMRAIRNQEEWDEKEWNDLTPSEQAMQGTPNDEAEQRLYNITVRELVKAGSKEAPANFVELRRMVETARQIAEQEMRNSQPTVESSKLSLRSNYQWAPQDYVVSLTSAIRDLEAQLEVMRNAAAGTLATDREGRPLTATPEEREQARQIAEATAALLNLMRQVSSQVDSALEAGDTDTVTTLVRALNKDLRAWWYADAATDELAFGKRRAVSIFGARFPLNSAGSFQLLRLQIDPDLTIKGIHNAALVPDEIQVPMGGDFDGDRIANMLRQLLPEESYRALRYGAGQLTADGTMLKAKPYLVSGLEKMWEVRQEPGTALHGVSTKTLHSLRSKLNEQLARTSMPARQRRVLVSRFVNQLAAANHGALKMFFDTLATRYQVPMRELAELIDDSPYLMMNRIVEDTFREFQNAVALHGPGITRSGLELADTTKNMPVWRPAGRVEQPSEIADAAMRANKYDIFRLLQVLKYNTRREATQTTPEQTASELAEYYRIFTARNDGIVRPGEDAIFETTIAQDRVLSWLRGIAEEYRATFGTNTTNEAMVMLAATKMADVDVSTGALRSNGDVLLVQGLLQQVVRQLRSEYAELMGDTSVAQRLASLESLTTPTYDDGAIHHAQGGDAFVEIFGAYPITELIGEQGANLAGFTVYQLREYLVSLRFDAREAFVASMRRHPSYEHVEGQETSPYRVLVDMVTESARMQLVEDRNTGTVRGVRARPSIIASANFADLHKRLRKIFHNRTGTAMRTADEARTLLASDPRLGEAVLRIVETRGVQAGTVTRTADGVIESVTFPQWIYDVIAEPSAKRAEMLLLRRTLEYAKLRLQTLDDDGNPTDELDPHRVNDRILRLWLDLDYRANQMNSDGVWAQVARDEFMRALTESTSVDEFIGRLNTDFRFRDERTAPYMAWARDRSIVEADRFGKGVSDVQEDVEMRDALRDAAQVAAAVLRDEEAVQSYLTDNANLISMLRDARDGVGDRELWNRFVSWFNIATQLPTLVGVSVWIQQAAHINEIRGQMGDKGKAPDNVAPLGRAIAAQLSTFDAAVGQLITSMTSGSLGTILTDMTVLARGERTFVLNDGTKVDWSGVTPEQAVDLLADPNTAALAARMLGMTAWDYNADLGQNVLVSVVGKGIAGFTADPEASLFGSDQASKFRRLMVLEGMAAKRGGTPIIPVILAERMNVRELGLDHPLSDKPGPDGTEREAIAVQELEWIADALDKLSRIEGLYEPATTGVGPMTLVKDEHTGADVSLIHRTLLRAGRKARIAKGVGNQVSRLLSVQDEGLRSIHHELILRWSHKLTKSAFASNNATLKRIAEQLANDLNKADKYVSPLDVLVDTYRDFDNPEVQKLLLAHARHYGDLATTAVWARDAVLKAQDPNRVRFMRSQDWHDLARAVIAHTMHINYGIATRSEMEISEFPSLTDEDAFAMQRSYWDPTFVESGVDIFAPGILQNPTAPLSPLLMAQLELVRTMGGSLPPVSSDEAERAVEQMIAPVVTSESGVRSGVTGDWHALVPALMHSAVGAVVSAPAASGISMAGINPGRLRLLLATTGQDWSRRPDDAELSRTTINGASLTTDVELGYALDSRMTVQMPGSATPVDKPLAQLEGRIAREVTLTLPGAAPISLLVHPPRYATGLVLPAEYGVPAGEAGVINLDKLADAVAAIAESARVPLSQVQVDIAFFHPDTKGLSALRDPDQDYEHSPWYDGVGAATDAAFSQQSILGGFYFGLDGAIPAAYETALAAIKKLSFALQQVTEMPESYRRELTADGLTDMGRMLDRMTEFALKQKIDGKSQSLRNYNAYRKLLELMYVVRYVDETGAHVLSAEQVIARQARGEQFTPENHAEVVGLPLQHVLALMGEQDLTSYEMIVTPWGERWLSPDVARAVPYTRFPEHAWTDQLFGGLTRVERDKDGTVTGWATTDLLSLPELRSVSLPRVIVTRRNVLSPRERTDTFGPYRKHQERVLSERMGRPGWQTRLPDQRARVQEFVRQAQRRGGNIGAQVFQSVELMSMGLHGDAASLLAVPRQVSVATNDATTDWVYVHLGEVKGGVAQGVFTTVADIADNAAMGDTVAVMPASFYHKQMGQSVADVLPAAIEVLRELMRYGITVRVPATDSGSAELRREMIRYLRDNGHVAVDGKPDTFEPRPRAEKTQARAAFESLLRRATHRTNRNRVLIVHTDQITTTNENAIYPVNDGLEKLGSYDLREVVQTARYAGYAPMLGLTGEQRTHVITTLLRVLDSEAGREYLQSMSEAKTTEDLADLRQALDDLRGKLVNARKDPSYQLLPNNGDELGTGDLIPLLSFNDVGELVGIHLYRHGHVSVSEANLRGALPEGNAALGAGGVRLTIDKAKVDDDHTTHRGTVVERWWRGLQGFEARIRVPIAGLGAKIFEVASAMKWTTTPAPSDLRVPTREILSGRPVLGMADIASPLGKTADSYWLNVTSRIVEAVGYDTMPHLVRLFRKVEFDPANPTPYGTARREVIEALRQFVAEHGGSIDPAALVTRRTNALSSVLRGQLAEKLNDLLEDQEVYFDDLGTEQRIADVTIATMVLASLAAGADLGEVLVAPGYIGAKDGDKSHTMHPVFTTLMDQLPHDHPARRAFVNQINARLLPDNVTEGYELLPNFTWLQHTVEPDGRTRSIPVMLSYPEIALTDTNDTMSEMAHKRRGRGSISPTTEAMAFVAWGAAPMLEREFRAGREVFSNPPMDEAQAKALYFGSRANTSPFVAREDDDLVLIESEYRYIYTKALPTREALSVPIVTDGWYEELRPAKAKEQRRAYERLWTDTLRALNLTDADGIYLTEMLRTVTARPAMAPGEGEPMTYRDAIAGLKLILANARDGLMPTHGGAANLVSRAALRRLYEVQYPLRAGNGSRRPLGSWNEWVSAVVPEVFSDNIGLRGYPAVSSIIDGLMFEYRKDIKGLPATVSNKLAADFGYARTHSGLFVASPRVRNALDAPIVQDGQTVEPIDLTTDEWMIEELPQDARAIVESRMSEWEGKNKLRRRRQSPKAEARRAARVREDLARTNTAMRYVQLWYVLKSLANPGLWVSSFLELVNSGVREKFVSFLNGETMGRLGNKFTPEQRKMWDDTVAALAESPAFYSLVYRNTLYQQQQGADTKLEQRLEHMTNRVAGVVNDPFWGTRAPRLAREFLEASWDTVSRFSPDRMITIERFLETAGTDVESLMTISPDAVAHGLTRIEKLRNMQDNLFDILRRSFVEGVIGSGLPTASTLGVLLLRLPTMFSRFRSNTLINLMGLQGANAVLTQLLSDREKSPNGLRDRLLGADEATDAQISATARIEDSYDLSRAIIRSGVSHTQLMMLGMILSAAGFGGDDDEEKLLNKLRRYQQPVVAKDPLALENDFRNADAWFSNRLPAGMGVPSWIIRPFVSPAMGVARFFETGDVRQVFYGFADALGSMPLLNADNVLNSWQIANELVVAAETEALEDDAEATSKASRYLWTAVGTLESMLFESAFLSMIYQGADEYDRDPYKFPQRDTDDNLQVDVFGNPRPTNALEDFIDPETDQPRQRYSGRNEFDAFLHSLGENRPIFAHVAALIKNDSTFIRYNMPVKTREVRAEELTEDEAAQIVMSIFNNETGREELTLDGAEAVVRGIRLGTVSMDSAALSGVFIPDDMRATLAERFLTEMTERYLALGYSKSESLRLAKREFYGQDFGEAEGFGVADILFGDVIPRYQYQQYYQLNTTYVMGPNGRPIATGLQRSVLASMGLHLNPLVFFENYHDGSTSNMEVDQLLNSVDSVRGINLGQRALMKVGENWLPPTQEEVAETIERALDKIADQIEDLNDNLDGRFTNGFGRSFGGGGGGGGGYANRAPSFGGNAQRLNTPRRIFTPYALDPRDVNTNNPFIRRASIRRERISSERGRLNQWQ